jgi:hypothetical protein
LEHKSFKVSEFLDAIPPILAGETKSNTTAVLTMLEQLAMNKNEFRTTIAGLACHVFIHQDARLQAKTAKLIQKYGGHETRKSLAEYESNIMQQTRQSLSEFLQPVEKKVPQKNKTITTTSLEPSSFEPVTHIKTIDDLTFLAAQAFDNNDPTHLRILPGALIEIQDEINSDNISKLQPALQRALKLMGGLRSTIGQLDHMMALFFIDVCIHLVRKEPGHSSELVKVFESFSQNGKWLEIPEDSNYLHAWKTYHQDPFYSPFKYFLLEGLHKIVTGDKTPLLSTPTHSPGWVDPMELVERLSICLEQDTLPLPNDSMIAFSSCSLRDTSKGISLAKKKLSGEWLNLVLFLFEKENKPVPPFTMHHLWMTALLTKRPKQMEKAFENFGYTTYFRKYAGQLSWKPIIEEYEWQDKKEKRTILKIEDLLRDKKDNNAGAEKDSDTSKKKKGQKTVPLIHDYLQLNTTYVTNEHNDIIRALMLVPNNPESFLPEIIRTCLKWPTFNEENSKRMCIQALKLLHEIWDDFGEMAHLFLVACMISSDKTVSTMAGEIWVRYVPQGKVDSGLIGRMVGIYQQVEFAPMKRFTDLIVQSFLKISEVHDEQLRIMIENCIEKLPDEPVKNLAKLLEVYVELKPVYAEMKEDVRGKLKVWGGKGSLKKVVGGLV